MISYIKGGVYKRGEGYFCIKTPSLGLKIYASDKTLDQLKEGQETEVYTSFVLKRDDFELYGFLSQAELELFETIQNIQGVGPKASLKITSIGTMEDLKHAVEKADYRYFEGVKGLGRRTVQKVIFEISGKIEMFFGKKKERLSDEDKIIADTLISLGYNAKDSSEAAKSIPKEIKNLQEKIKYCLKVLGKK